MDNIKPKENNAIEDKTEKSEDLFTNISYTSIPPSRAEKEEPRYTPPLPDIKPDTKSVERVEPEEIQLDRNADDIVAFTDEDGDKRHPGEVYMETLKKIRKLDQDSENPILFNTVPCRLVNGKLEQIQKESYRPIMADMIKFYQETNNGAEAVFSIPDHLVTSCFNHPKFGSIFPTVNRVTSAPLFMKDGTILSSSGYVEDLKIWQLPGIDFEPLDSLEEAVRVLKEPFKDFEFKDESSEANAWSYFFTMLMYPFIDGNVPFFSFTGSTPGTGKGMLCRVLHRIVEGGDPKMLGWENESGVFSESNLRRTVSSAILKGAPVYMFDNVTAGSKINSNFLAAIATQRDVDIRVLYKTEEKSVRVSSIFVFTGNNISVSDDLRRRTQSIILNTDDPNPETREFDIDIELYVLEHRQELLSAALSILKFWHENGRPLCKKRKGSFQNWISMIGGIIEFAGFGELDNGVELDQSYTSIQNFIETIYNNRKSDRWRITDVLELALGSDGEEGPLFHEINTNSKQPAQEVGKKISGYSEDRPFNVEDWETGDKLVVKLIKDTSRRGTWYHLSVISVQNLSSNEEQMDLDLDADILEDVPF